MKTKLPTILIAALPLVATVSGSTPANATDSGWRANGGGLNSTGGVYACETGCTKWVYYEAAIWDAEGHNFTWFASGNFNTELSVQCTGSMSPYMYDSGTAADPGAGSLQHFCPWGETGMFTSYLVDPL